jgi:PIN domain nuclease of toxin-antitoxin system
VGDCDQAQDRQAECDRLILLPIQYDHILQMEHLPRFHGDPFDRLLIAQALHEGLPILTNDARFRDYGVQVIW